MFMEERLGEILRRLEKDGSIRTADIQADFDVAADTARRDLRILETRGLLKRTHGGAVRPDSTLPKNYTPRDIKVVRPNYLAIAKRAVELINEGDVIYVTGASIGYFMAQNLPHDKHFTVLTNSIVIADLLRSYENITTVMPGGEMTPMGQFCDSLAEHFVADMRIDKAFLTSAGISAEYGMTVERTTGIGFMRAIVGSAGESIALYPSHKVGKVSTLRVCAANKFSRLITDSDVEDDQTGLFEELGVQVEILNA